MIQDERVYIAGPMRGLPRCNFPAFDSAERKLRRMGYTNIFNPAERDRQNGFRETEQPTTFMVKQAFVEDIREIVWNCGTIAMLPGYRDHPQSLCHSELAIAKAFGLKVIELEDE
jgi:hypothetical protein